MMTSLRLTTLLLLTAIVWLTPAHAADAARPKPLRALLVIGGCCHDYKTQKNILKQGIEERANVVVDICYCEDKSTKPPLPILGKPDYGAGYDVIIHDECAASISDAGLIEGVLKPHRDGIPGVNLHCAMHCYRIGNPGEPADPASTRALWFNYLGLQSSGHGPQAPIAVVHTDKAHPVTRGLEDWTTINEELYNNIKVLDTAQPLARGKQHVSQRKKQKDGTEKLIERDDDYVVTWTNTYNGRTRVFSTTLGHNNKTCEDARYLDLVTRGLLWACDKLDTNSKPKAGYGPAGH